MNQKTISAVMSHLGKKGKGVKKKFSKEEIKKRTERLKKYSKHNFASGVIVINLDAKTKAYIKGKKKIEKYLKNKKEEEK